MIKNVRVYVRELPRHLPQQLPKRERKISSDYQVTICCVCVVVSNFQRTLANLFPASRGLHVQISTYFSKLSDVYIHEKPSLSGDNESNEKERDRKRFCKEINEKPRFPFIRYKASNLLNLYQYFHRWICQDGHHPTSYILLLIFD